MSVGRNVVLSTNSEESTCAFCKQWEYVCWFCIGGRRSEAVDTAPGVMFADYYIVRGNGEEEIGFGFERIYLTHD